MIYSYLCITYYVVVILAALGTLLVIRVRAWNTSAIMPQRWDFVKPYLASQMKITHLDIQPIRSLGYYAGYFFSFLLTFPAVLFRKYDFVILENPYLSIFAPLIRCRRKRVIAEYIDYYPANLHRLRNQRFFRYQVAKIVCRIFHHFANYITTESQTGLATLNRWGVPKSKIKIVPVGVDITSMHFQENERQKLRKEWHISDDTVVIGYLGKLVDYYNLDRIFEAVSLAKAEINKYTIVIAGSGPYLDNLREKAKQLQLSTIFTGQIAHQYIYEYYSAFDVFIFPLNALAIKIGEILSIGLPIIVPKGMAEDWIIDGQTGLVAKNQSPKAFTEQLLRYMALTASNKDQLRKNAIAFAKKNLDVREVAKLYIKLCYSKE